MLCVLVNRTFNRELPIQPDFYGIAIDTTASQKVKVDNENNRVILY
jgi:pyrimidine operon attenuation protein/uracil phosphoribosyltransferase